MDSKICDLESELDAVRMTAAESQLELDRLNRRLQATEQQQEQQRLQQQQEQQRQQNDPEVDEKVRKYPQLKALAFDLKARLLKRAE